MLRTTVEIHMGHTAKGTFGKVNVVVKALRELSLDPAPFRPLFPEMSALMARRHRIVHEADLPTANAVTDAPWTIGDDYQLVVWLFVVVAFASGLRMGLDPSRIVDEWFAEQRIGFIRKLTEVRRKLVAAPNEEKKLALQVMADTVAEIQALLPDIPATVRRFSAIKISPPQAT